MKFKIPFYLFMHYTENGKINWFYFIHPPFVSWPVKYNNKFNFTICKQKQTALDNKQFYLISG